MSGFKAFVLRGNLVDLAVAVIIGTAFGTVVSSFVAWLTDQMPKGASEYFSNDAKSFGAFLNAVVAFVILAAVVYFAIVTPYTKAKAKFFPSEAEGKPADIALLEEIRDLLAANKA
ncbi:MAG: MscL family protein [Propionibacteriales bacterium]|nr:MscL family protein [Propionibacteriales bacterium]